LPGSHTSRARRCGIDGDVQHAALQVQGLVSEPAARGAAQSLEQHGNGAGPARFGARQALDEFGPVVRRPPIRARRFVSARARTVAIPVVVVEARAGDEFRDGLAAVAADGLLF